MFVSLVAKLEEKEKIVTGREGEGLFVSLVAKLEEKEKVISWKRRRRIVRFLGC